MVDLKKGTAPLYTPLEYALYVSFFPQLIAGPIVRHNELIPQLGHHPLRVGWPERIGRGFTLFIVGLAKKVLVADMLGMHSDSVFEIAKTQAPSMLEAWTGTLAFSFQIYFDFSAYSDMAIGLALIFGFVLPINFNSPYKACTISDFWRRWHMTLSRFLRDYLYIPLGGSRRGQTRRILATVATMGVCGLWHGAGWTFVVWGLWHGFGLVANFTWTRIAFTMPRILSWSLTMAFVVVGWVFFRAESFQSVDFIFGAMSGLEASSENLAKSIDGWKLALVLCIALFLPNSHEMALERLKPNKAVALILGLVLGSLYLELGNHNYQEFIYFEF